jgi:hypothetical protein
MKDNFKTLGIVFILLSIAAIVGCQGKTNSADGSYLDLGLTSGTLWATCNLGGENVWDFGDFYAWGETEKKTIFTWDSYKYSSGVNGCLTKYCNNATFGKNGFTDNILSLQLSDDVAALRCGEDCSLPSMAQWKELKENCTWTWTQNNGINGYQVKGNNGNEIFIPAAGCYVSNSKGHEGFSGGYWSSELVEEKPLEAHAFIFLSDKILFARYLRYYGMSIRAVSKKKNEGFIDLGLPSGIFWSSSNLDAENPWDFGKMYAWGEIEFKSNYSWTSYKHSDGLPVKFTKYSTHNDLGETDVTDTILQSVDDVATVKLGTDWSMPTSEQFKELIKECQWTWTTRNGVNGYDIKGPNGAILFMAAAGALQRQNDSLTPNACGLYFSSTLNSASPDYAFKLVFYDGYAGIEVASRYYGHTIRPVRRKK